MKCSIFYAQYNKTYDYLNLGWSNLFYSSLCIADDSIAYVPGAFPMNGNLISTLTKINSWNGTTIDERITFDTTILDSYYGGGGIISIGNSIYICGYIYNTNTDSAKASFYKIHSDNSINRYYYDFGVSNASFSGFDIVYRNNLIYVTGTIQYSLIDTDGLLAVLDTNGNLVDYRTYGGSGFELLYGIDTTSNGGFILSGWTESYGNGSEFYPDGYLVKIDTNLDEEWYKTYGIPNEGDGIFVKSLPDEEFLVYGENDDLSTPIDDAWVAKLDSLGNIIWDYRYIPDQMNNYTPTVPNSFGVIDAILIENGNIALLYADREIVGYTPLGNVISNPIGMFQLLNTNGDTLYSRKLKIRDDDNYVNGMIRTSDGGFLISGYVFPDDTSNTEDGWLIKLDSTFCEVDSCIGYAAPDPIPIPKPNPFTNTGWILYPNPSTNGFNITPPYGSSLWYDPMIHVYNYLGQEVFSTKTVGGWVYIETNTWTSGMYTVRIFDSYNRDLYCAKVMVQH